MSILIPKIRVQTVSNDTSACFRYRLQEPVKAVEASDREFIFSHVPQLNAAMASRYDIVIFQRPLSRVVADSISYLQSKGVKVIVDIDDDFEAVHRNNVAFANIQPRNNPDFNWEWLILACKRADLVTTSTEYLASKYKSNTGGSIVLPNFLPNDILSVNGTQHRGRVRIGWTGRVMTHPNDLPMVGSSVKKAVKKLGADFVIVGDGLGVPEQVKLEKHEVHVTGNVPIDRYYKTVADNIDIGIAPLEPSEFNEAKCLDKDTKVLTQSGVKNIIDVKVGDKVYDRFGNLKEVLGQSIEPARSGIKLTTEDGYTISMSKEHRLLVNNRWVHGRDIAVGDVLHLSTVSHAAHDYNKVNWPSNSRMTPIVSIEEVEITPVDIQVEGEEFIANGFVSHNSYLKMLEYSGLGIPSIGSPTAENILLNEDGIGIIAHTQAEWSRAFSLLISNERKREQLGQEARRVVKDKYTINKNAYMWADTWKSLVGRGLTV